MTVDQVKRIIKKRNGMLSDKQLQEIQRMLKDGEISDQENFDIKEYAHKCVMGLDDVEDDAVEDDDDSMEDESEEGNDPIQLIEQALEQLKAKYDAE